jgi:uncharacterized integral membrane protein
MESSMKKGTLIIWAIIFGCIALVIFQNQTFFMAKQSFRINPGIFQEYHSPELPNAVMVLFFFFLGLFIAYLFSFAKRFKANRTIKKLNATITSCNNELAELRREINTLKGIESPAEDLSATTKIEMDATQKITDESAGESPVDADKTIKYSTADRATDPNDQNTEDKSSEM